MRFSAIKALQPSPIHFTPFELRSEAEEKADADMSDQI
tara:strand:+ start:2855 stop:2968 length:114 start_codon:yes stop_codon:yes gene_type:complete